MMRRPAMMMCALAAVLLWAMWGRGLAEAHPSAQPPAHRHAPFFSLAAGGLTIGGPGVARINTNSALTVMELSGGTLRSVCATAHNRGPGIASLRIVRSGNDRVDKLVKNGQSRALCGEGQLVEIACEVQDCTVLWRVDRLPQ